MEMFKLEVVPWNRMRHYLYRHIRVDTGDPFYIGVGTKSVVNHRNILGEYRRAYSKNNRKKISEAKLGKPSWALGRQFSKEHIDNLKESHMGIPNKYKGKTYDEIYGEEKSLNLRKLMSEKSKQKVGPLNSFYGKNHTIDYKRNKGKIVEQYDKDNNYLNTYYTLSEAAEHTNSDVRLISAVCLGKRKTHNNFIWKFKSSTTK